MGCSWVLTAPPQLLLWQVICTRPTSAFQASSPTLTAALWNGFCALNLPDEEWVQCLEPAQGCVASKWQSWGDPLG